MSAVLSAAGGWHTREPAMKTKMIIIGFLLSIAVITMISFYALYMTQGIVTKFTAGEYYFESIAKEATFVAGAAKRAENHLLLYLALHRPADRKAYPHTVASLEKALRILNREVRHPDARIILDKIRGQTDDLLPKGQALIEAHDAAMAQTGTFDMTTQKDQIRHLYNRFSAIRGIGVQLALFEIGQESQLEQSVIRGTKRLRSVMIGLMILAFGFTVYLAAVLNRMIRTIQRESRQREEARAEVKVLSGMLPICMSCKKIRDDQGYWNQLESYIHEHSDAVFSHGMCPECMKIHYPEFADAIQAEAPADESGRAEAGAAKPPTA